MVARSTTVYYGRGNHETLFVEAEDAAEAEKQLTVKIEKRVERLLHTWQLVIGIAIACVGLMAFAWSSYLSGQEGADGFLPITVTALVFLLSRPVLALTQRAWAWSHEQAARARRKDQQKPVTIRPDWTWK